MPHDDNHCHHPEHEHMEVQAVAEPVVVIAEQAKHKLILTVDRDNAMNIVAGDDVDALQISFMLTDASRKMLMGYSDPRWGPATPRH